MSASQQIQHAPLPAGEEEIDDKLEKSSTEHDIEHTAAASALAEPTYPKMSTAAKIVLVILVVLTQILQISAGIGMAITTAEIGHDLRIPGSQLQWIGTAGSLATACTLLIGGRLADMYGHKPFFVFGTAIGGATFLGLGLSKSRYEFFIFRALGGCAFSGVTSAAIGILGRSFPPGPAKSRAFAALGAGAPVGTAVGLVLAGITTEYTSIRWRCYFFIAAGLSLITSIGAFFVAPGSVRPIARPGASLRSLDWLGAALSSISMISIVFALGYGEVAPKGWRTPYIPATLSVGVVLAGIFLYWQHYLETKLARAPLMKLSIWRKGRFAWLMAVIFPMSGGFSVLLFWMTLYWQNFEGRSIAEATLRFVPLCIVGVCANIVGSHIVAIVPGHIMLCIGGLATTLAALLFAICPAMYTYFAYQLPACMVMVLGADFMFLVGMLYNSKLVSGEDQAQVGGIFSVVTQLGGVFILAISTIVSDRLMDREALKLGIVDASRLPQGEVPKNALLVGYRGAFWTCFAFTMFSAILAMVALRGIGIVGQKKTKKEVTDSPAEIEK